MATYLINYGSEGPFRGIVFQIQFLLRPSTRYMGPDPPYTYGRPRDDPIMLFNFGKRDAIRPRDF